MLKLVFLLVAAVVLAYFSQQYTEPCTATGAKYRMSDDWAYILLVVILVLFRYPS